MPVNSLSCAAIDLSPTCTRLANGVQVAVFSQPSSTQAAFSVRVAAGSHDEPAEHPGLAHFLEHLLFLDCAEFAADQRLMPFVQTCGGRLNASTQARHTDYFCEVPAAHLQAALARLCAMLAQPLLTVAAQLAEREVLHAEFLARAQDANTLVAAALGQALADGHVFAAFQAGSRDTLAVEQGAFQQALHDFHRQHYQGANVALVLVGPQPVAELQALAQQCASQLGRGMPLPALPPSALLPLRRQQLQLQLPSGIPTLHLTFALALAPTDHAGDLQQALGFIQTWLLAESSGGLLAQLRIAQLCTDLSVRLLYQHGDQALWLLSFAGVADDGAAQAELAAALCSWWVFFARQVPCSELAERYRLIKTCRPSRSPLALAQEWQAALALGITPGQGLSESAMQLLPRLLQQLQAPQRCISLFASQALQPMWPGQHGFALRLREVTQPIAISRYWAWQLPARNPLLGDALATLPRLAIAAELDWLGAPRSASANDQAVLHGLCRFATQLPPAQLLAVAQVAWRELTANAEQVGFNLQLSAQRGALQLLLQGPSRLLAQLLGQLLACLLAPGAEVWPQALQLAKHADDAAQMPLRQLLGRLPELFEAGMQTAPADSTSELQQGYRLTDVVAQISGVAVSEQARITALFNGVTPLALSPRPDLPIVGRRYWLVRPVATPEVCVLLFCPLPSRSACAEAGWRLLAHCYQSPFFQRLRSELQLGYGVFCGFRQVQGRHGILFAVQSSHASQAEILDYIRDFLAGQTPRFVALTADALKAFAQTVAEPLNVARLSLVERAELHWQQHLAGHTTEHANAVLQALSSYERKQLLRCQQQLLDADGGWYLLSNQAPSANDWLPLA